MESWWKQLDGRSFERELAELFKGRGYQVRWTGRPGDEGVDLRLEAMHRTIIVQCKAHKNRLGSATVRELYGALLHHGADEAWLISTAGFRRGAKSFAVGKRLQLLTIRQVLEGHELAQIPAERT